MAPHPRRLESSVLSLLLLLLHRKHENYKLSKHLYHAVIRQIGSSEYSHAPVSTDSLSAVYRGPKKDWKIMEINGL
jgi:hypothetical protein